MSWIYKVDHKFDNVDLETLLNTLDIGYMDILDDKAAIAANYQEIDEVFKLGTLFMGIVLPFLICAAYALCLWILVKMLARPLVGTDPDIIEKEIPKERYSFPILSLIQFLVFILMVSLVLADAEIHSKVSQRWKTIRGKEEFYSAELSDLKEALEVIGDVITEVRKRALDEFMHGRQDMESTMAIQIERVLQKGVTSAVELDNVINDLDDKKLAIGFSSYFILSSIISIWLWLNVIFKQMTQRFHTFSILTISCMFLTAALTAVYMTGVQFFLINYIHPDSSSIQEYILELFVAYGRQIVDTFENLLFDA